MNKENKSSVFSKIFKSGVISWIIIIGVWWLGSLAYDEYFLPSPTETLSSMGTLIGNGVLLQDILASFGRIFKGWLLAAAAGIPLGLLVGNFIPVRWLVEPILNFFRFVPAIALTTLFLMWFGVGEESKVALIFYASFFPVLVNTIAGVATTDKSLVEAASCMGASKLRVFFTVVVPSAVPNIFTGVRLALGGSITCVVAAEMLVGNNGLGYLIQSSKMYYKTGWAFAGIITLAIIGFACDRLISVLGRKYLKRFGVK